MKIPKLLFLSFLLLSFGGCRKNPLPLSEFPIPAVIGDGWEVSSLKAQNIDVSQIAEADKALKNDLSFRNIHTLTIARNGKLVLNEFYHSALKYPFAQGAVFKRGDSSLSLLCKPTHTIVLR